MRFLLLTSLFCATGTMTLAAGEHADSHGHGHTLDFGQPAEAATADRTVAITMTDNAYDIAKIEVAAGETVRFVVENAGEFLHEFNIGTAHMHAEHQDEMAQMMADGHMDAFEVSMPMAHDDPNAVLLAPGETGELTWTFTTADTLEFACNLPGHYQSGMVGALNVGS